MAHAAPAIVVVGEITYTCSRQDYNEYMVVVPLAAVAAIAVQNIWLEDFRRI